LSTEEGISCRRRGKIEVKSLRLYAMQDATPNAALDFSVRCNAWLASRVSTPSVDVLDRQQNKADKPEQITNRNCYVVPMKRVANPANKDHGSDKNSQLCIDYDDLPPNVKGSVAGRPRKGAYHREPHSTRGRRRSTAAGG